MATLLCPWDSSCLENPMDRGVWLATVHGSQRVRHNWATNTFTFKHTQSMKTQKSEFSSQLPPAKVSPCQMSNVLVMTAVNFRLLSSSAFNSYRLSFFSFLLGAFMTFWIRLWEVKRWVIFNFPSAFLYMKLLVEWPEGGEIKGQ